MMQRKQIQSLSLIALLALMIILMGRIFLPYTSVLLWSAVAYILISPLYMKIVRRMDRTKRFFEIKRHFLAGLFAVLTVLVMAGIFFFIGFQVIGQGRVFIEEAKSFIEANPHFFSNTDAGTTIAAVVRKVSLGTVDISTIDLKAEVLSFLSSYSTNIVSITKSIAKNVGGFIISLAFICFALYFFFVDATYLANLFINAIPIDQRSTKRLLVKFRDVTKNLFMGFFLVAFYQAIAAFIIFTIFHVRGSLLFSVLILFCSFVPMVGCALVWLPLGITVIISKGLVTGIVFLVLCAIFISFLDNFLRPFFLKDRIKIHPLLIFFSILGGLQVFGFNGILLGPLVIILFFTIVDITLEEEVLTMSPSGESQPKQKRPEDETEL
jgi:predicted PurR-regulated permease PerM